MHAAPARVPDGLRVLLQLRLRREDERLAGEERLPARVHLARHRARVQGLLPEARQVVVAVCGRKELVTVGMTETSRMGNRSAICQTNIDLRISQRGKLDH